MRKGFTLIELMIAIAIIAIIAAIAIPNLLEARKSGNESAAIGSMRTLSTAQVLYKEGDKDENGSFDYATSLSELSAPGDLIDNVLASGKKQGYCFIVFSNSGSTWHGHADPRLPGETGDRAFYVDEIGVIRSGSGSPAGPADTPLGGVGGEPSSSTDHRGGEQPSCDRRDEGLTLSEALPRFANHAIMRLAQLTETEILDRALGLAESQEIQQLVLSAMDVNGDGALNFEETLTMDLLSLARAVKDAIADNPEEDVILGEDHMVDQPSDWFLHKVENMLHLGIANETELPNVSIDSMVGDPNLPPPQAPPL